jgi:hypothetical protein
LLGFFFFVLFPFLPAYNKTQRKKLGKENDMNEEIEYAEMLEIPVSTVNVVRKKRKGKKAKTGAEWAQTANGQPNVLAEDKKPDLKQSVIAQVNDKLTHGQTDLLTAESELFAESANSGGKIDFSDIPDRIDTIRLFSENDRVFFNEETDDELDENLSSFLENHENEGGRYALKHETRAQKRARIALGVEFAAVCALCGGIFLTNVFMPNSAINTFFRALDGNYAAAQTDARTWKDFTLSGVVNDFSTAELTLSETGVLSITSACHVYPVADGKVADITANADGSYSLKIAHSDSFSGVINGLEQVYYRVGDEVKANVPVGYADGEQEVQITMYSQGALLNCFELNGENELAWVAEE